MPAAKNAGQYLPDDFEHELATSYLVKDKGLVVLTSCSRRGVINTVRQAMVASGVDKGARCARRLPHRAAARRQGHPLGGGHAVRVRRELIRPDKADLTTA
jgi:hypothetical protein